MTACLVCGKDTNNPRFCSRSCAAKRNNVLAPKRRMQGTCAVCGDAIPHRNKYCHAHRPKPLDRDLPIGAIADGSDHPACRHARLRQDARRVYYASMPVKCVRCGYDKHVEICHRKALATFPLDTPISVVNSLDNLVGLCPNCHWELDNGLLQI